MMPVFQIPILRSLALTKHFQSDRWLYSEELQGYEMKVLTN